MCVSRRGGSKNGRNGRIQIWILLPFFAFRLGRPEERWDPTLDPVAFCLGRPEERLSLIGFDESGTFTCTIATEA